MECGNWLDGDPAGLVGWQVTSAPGEDTKPWLCPEVLGEGGLSLPSWDSICEEMSGAAALHLSSCCSSDSSLHKHLSSSRVV